MPTTPRRARLWLKAKRARVVLQHPFTIRLRFPTQTYRQSVQVGVDTGSKVVGIAALTTREVLFQAEVHLRDNISEKVRQRRQYRRNRRDRKTRYRQPRWRNRRRAEGWLAPSILSKAQATCKAVYFLASCLPVDRIQVEVGSFDTQKLQHPEITALEYQQGELHGYLLRAYVLQKWFFTCAYCGTREVPLELEHIVPTSRGGSNRVSNLTVACHSCNQRKGEQTAAEFGFPQIQAQAQMPLRDAAHVSALKSKVVGDLQASFGITQVQVSYGYETSYQRIQVLKLSKSHVHDAIAIACEPGEVVTPVKQVSLLRAVPRGQYQQFNGRRSEHKCWSARKVRGFKLYEVVKIKGQVGYIGGRREKGAFLIKDLRSGKKMAEVTPRKLERVARASQGWMIGSYLIERKEGGASSPS